MVCGEYIWKDPPQGKNEVGNDPSGQRTSILNCYGVKSKWQIKSERRGPKEVEVIHPMDIFTYTRKTSYMFGRLHSR